MAMGDRRCLQITFRKADEIAFAEMLCPHTDKDLLDEDDFCYTVLYSSVDHGALAARKKLAARGLCFVGRSDAGVDYHGAAFAAVDKQHADVPALGEKPLVLLKNKGDINKRSLAAARRYLDIRQKAIDRLLTA
jgi:hypothetical protein